jgi:hypothetical protein
MQREIERCKNKRDVFNTASDWLGWTAARGKNADS